MNNQLFVFTLVIISLVVASCSGGEQKLENFVPLKCVYPGALELDQQTQDDLSKYKQSPLQEKPVSRGFPSY